MSSSVARAEADERGRRYAAPMSAPARPTFTKRKAIFAVSRDDAEVGGERDHRARARGVPLSAATTGLRSARMLRDERRRSCA